METENRSIILDDFVKPKLIIRFFWSTMSLSLVALVSETNKFSYFLKEIFDFLYKTDTISILIINNNML